MVRRDYNGDGLGSIPSWAGGDLPRGTRYLTAKYDGHMLRVTKDTAGTVTATTRRPVDVTAQVRELPWYASVHRLVPGGTTLVGELWLPGGDRSQVKTALKQRGPLALTVFGIDEVPDEHWSGELYRADLRRVEAMVSSWGLSFAKYWPLSTHWLADIVVNQGEGYSLTDWMTDREAEDPDLEGFVLSGGNMSFLGKWKPEHTVDLVVTGTRDADLGGKYAGMVGSLLVSTIEGHEVAAVSGMDDDLRRWMTDHEDELEGRVVEVAYQTVGSRGRLVHPRFRCWRDDKVPAQCTLDQDLRLRAYWIEEARQ